MYGAESMKRILLSILLIVILILIPVTVNSAPYASNNEKPTQLKPSNKVPADLIKKHTFSHINKILDTKLIPDLTKYLDSQEIKHNRTVEESKNLAKGIELIIKMYHENRTLLFITIQVRVKQTEIILFMQLIEWDTRTSKMVPLLISKIIPLFKR